MGLGLPYLLDTDLSESLRESCLNKCSCVRHQHWSYFQAIRVNSKHTDCKQNAQVSLLEI